MIIGDLFQHNEKQLAKLFRLSGCRFLSVNYSPSYDQKNIFEQIYKILRTSFTKFQRKFCKNYSNERNCSGAIARRIHCSVKPANEVPASYQGSKIVLKNSFC